MLDSEGRRATQSMIAFCRFWPWFLAGSKYTPGSGKPGVYASRVFLVRIQFARRSKFEPGTPILNIPPALGSQGYIWTGFSRFKYTLRLGFAYRTLV